MKIPIHPNLAAAAGAGWFLLASGCITMPWTPAPYRLEIVGIEDKEVTAALAALTDLPARPAKPDQDPRRLERRYRADAAKLQRYLEAQGLARAEVSLDIEQKRKQSVIRFTVSGTNVYTVRSVKVTGWDVLPEQWTHQLVGQPLSYTRIDEAGRRLVRTLQNQGYPSAAVEHKTVGLDHETQEAEVRYSVQAGAPAVMGSWQVDGLKRVDPRFVERRVPWVPGDVYQRSLVDQFSRQLSESGLFSYVGVSRADEDARTGVYDVAVHLKERRRRTIGVGAAYQSDTGPEARLQWQHRNLFGMGQKFELDAKYAEDLWLGLAVLTLPDWLRGDQDLNLGVKASEESTDAYLVRYGKVFLTVQHRWSESWSGTFGPALRESVSEQLDADEAYLQVSFPVTLFWNGRDDVLNPTRGFGVAGGIEPFYDLEEQFGFFKSMVTPAVYLPLAGETLVLSSRLTLGSISGVSLDGIPPDLRFYAGGGQSIRGYQYQSVGPREEGRPVGGKSLVEASVELRWRFWRNLGTVVFLDGGSAYEPEISDFRESFQWGTGLGFRYFTGVGPVRIDVGLPLNPRDGIDNDYEFYISIGQAF